MLKGFAFLGLFSGISGNAGIIGISWKSPIIPIIPSVPIVPFINLCAKRTLPLRQNFVMPRLCYGSAEQVNLLCSRLNRKVHLSLFTFQFSPFSLNRAQPEDCALLLIARCYLFSALEVVWGVVPAVGIVELAHSLHLRANSLLITAVYRPLNLRHSAKAR